MHKFIRSCFFYSAVCFLVLLFSMEAFQAELIRIIGAPWTPGFFEIASDLSSNDDWIYLSDMNNSKIQVYSKELTPLFHFGGYGSGPGNFIEIRGLCATSQNLFVASIDSFASRTGRIQAFSKRGIFEFEFENPKERSDFISVAELRNKSLAAITERTLCLYQANGQLLNEVSSISGHSFLFLQDIVAVPERGFALIDRAKRGFFVLDLDLRTIQQYGEEYINIPVAIDYHDKRYIVADANGDLHLFQQNGRFVKTVPTSIYSNGIRSIAPNRLLMTSALRRGIAQVDLSTGKVQEIFFVPRNTMELHWPESMAINSQQELYISDDYFGGMKIYSLKNSAYIGQSGWFENQNQGLKIISLASSVNSSQVYALSRTNMSSIYVFEGAQLVETISQSEQDYFCQLHCDLKGNLYALSCSEKSIFQFDAGGKFINKIILPLREQNVIHFSVTDQIHVLYANGELIMFPVNHPTQLKYLQLQSREGFSFGQVSSIVHHDKYLILCYRQKHCLMIHDLSTGDIVDIFGSMGGPKTYPSKENLQVDIGYQPGLFLFPSAVLTYDGMLYISDAGNHRIQIIPFSYLATESTLIVLKIGSTKAFVNHQEIELEVAPFILQQRTMVPLRFISEAFGANVEWYANERKIVLGLEQTIIELWIQQNRALVNKEEIFMDVPPVIILQRTLVPIRFISEAFRAQVEWEPIGQTISIRRKKQSL